MTDLEVNPLEKLSLKQLRQRTSMKWRAYPAEVLPLWIAEMDVPLAEPIAQALRRAIDQGDTGYPSLGGYAPALARFAARRWGWTDFPVEDTCLVADLMTGVTEVLRLVTAPGGAVIVTAPVYPPFYLCVEHLGLQVVAAELTPAGRLDLDRLTDVFARVSSARRRTAFLMANPHNPTGAVHTSAELAEVAALADRYGVRVVVDEIHAPLVLPGARFTPYLSVSGGENGFTVMSASKAWNLAGVKSALIIAGSAAAPDLRRIPQIVTHGPSHLGEIGHVAAYEHGEPWLDALLQGLDRNRTLLGQLLAEHLPQVGYLPPEGTYLAWLDCAALPLYEGGPAAFFLDRASVALNAGHPFGAGAAAAVRLNFATSRAVLTEAVTRMGAAVDHYRDGRRP